MVTVNVFAASAIALIPALVLAGKLSGTKSKYWMFFLLGGGGWFIAMVLRVPLVNMVSSTMNGAPLGIFLISALAGVFEEPTRYFLVKKIISSRSENIRGALVLGLGWGYVEAVIIYVVSIAMYSIIRPDVTFLDLLPGALERNFAIIFHMAMCLLVLAASLRSIFLVLLAIFLHTMFNFTAVSVMIITENIFLTEATILSFAMFSLLISIMILSKYLKTKQSLENPMFSQ